MYKWSSPIKPSLLAKETATMMKTTTDAIDTGLIDQLLRNYKKPEDVWAKMAC